MCLFNELMRKLTVTARHFAYLKEESFSMIHIGIPTLIETKSIEDCTGLCKEFGYQFVELNMNMPQYQVENIDIINFAEVAKKNGIYYTIHLDENLNVCDFSIKRLRLLTLKRFLTL